MNEKLTMDFQRQDDMSHHSGMEHKYCTKISVNILNLSKLLACKPPPMAVQPPLAVVKHYSGTGTSDSQLSSHALFFIYFNNACDDQAFSPFML